MAELFYDGRPYFVKTVKDSSNNTIKEKVQTYDLTSDAFAKDYRFGKMVNYITMGEFQFKNRKLAQKRIIGNNVTRDSDGNIISKTPIYAEDDVYRDEKVLEEWIEENRIPFDVC